MRPVADTPGHDRHADQCQCRCTEHDALPVESETSNQMGSCTSDRQGTDEDPERHSPPRRKPTGHHLETARIDPGECSPGQNPQTKRRHECITVESDQQRIGRCSDEAADDEDLATVEPVGDSHSSQAERTDNEPDLNCKRQADRLAGTQRPQNIELRCDRRGREPKRQCQELGSGDRYQGPALSCWRLGFSRLHCLRSPVRSAPRHHPVEAGSARIQIRQRW